MNYEALAQVAVISLALASISVTIAKTKIFAPTRAWIDEKSEWFGDLVHCPYCTSHWLTFAAVAYYQPRIIESDLLIVDLVISVFAVVCLTAWFGGLIYRAYRTK